MTYSRLVEYISEERVVGEDRLDALYGVGDVARGEGVDLDGHDCIYLQESQISVEYGQEHSEVLAVKRIYKSRVQLEHHVRPD